MRWPVVVPVLVLSLTCAAGTGGAYTLRSPQVAFNGVALQAALDAWNGGVQANTDQVDVQVFSFGVVDRSFVVELRKAGGFEFGVYDPLDAGDPARHPLFTTTSGAGGFAQCRLVRDSVLAVVEFDSLAVPVRSETYPWAGHASFGFYAAGPGGTWYSQDARNAGTPRALTYVGTGVNSTDLMECFEPDPYDPASPEAFARLLVLVQPSLCGAPSSRAGRALGVECTPTATSTWGRLKAIYR